MMNDPIGATVFVVTLFGISLSLLLQATSYRIRHYNQYEETSLKYSWSLTGVFMSSTVFLILSVAQLVYYEIAERITGEQYDVVNSILAISFIVQLVLAIVSGFTILGKKDKGEFALLPPHEW
ncbi:hypothetical protein HG444_001700 [Candidatus Saccharibacteria bacterium]|nr:hypothetical protein [Candidatus Saccharibacteria bacterium]